MIAIRLLSSLILFGSPYMGWCQEQPANEDTWQKLIEQLDDESFEVRERVTAELLRAPDAVVPLLQEALPKCRSAERKTRLTFILRQLGPGGEIWRFVKKPNFEEHWKGVADVVVENRFTYVGPLLLDKGTGEVMGRLPFGTVIAEFENKTVFGFRHTLTGYEWVWYDLDAQKEHAALSGVSEPGGFPSLSTRRLDGNTLYVIDKDIGAIKKAKTLKEKSAASYSVLPQFLYAIDLDARKFVWKVRLSNTLFMPGSPTTLLPMPGIGVAAMQMVRLPVKDPMEPGHYEGILKAHGARDGALLWNQTVPDIEPSELLFDQDGKYLYVSGLASPFSGADRGKIVRVDATQGTLLDEMNIPGIYPKAITAIGDKVLLASVDSYNNNMTDRTTLHLVDLTAQKTVWKRALAADGACGWVMMHHVSAKKVYWTCGENRGVYGARLGCTDFETGASVAGPSVPGLPVHWTEKELYTNSAYSLRFAHFLSPGSAPGGAAQSVLGLAGGNIVRRLRPWHGEECP